MFPNSLHSEHYPVSMSLWSLLAAFIANNSHMPCCIYELHWIYALCIHVAHKCGKNRTCHYFTLLCRLMWYVDVILFSTCSTSNLASSWWSGKSGRWIRYLGPCYLCGNHPDCGSWFWSSLTAAVRDIWGLSWWVYDLILSLFGSSFLCNFIFKIMNSVLKKVPVCYLVFQNSQESCHVQYLI